MVQIQQRLDTGATKSLAVTLLIAVSLDTTQPAEKD